MLLRLLIQIVTKGLYVDLRTLSADTIAIYRKGQYLGSFPAIGKPLDPGKLTKISNERDAEFSEITRKMVVSYLESLGFQIDNYSEEKQKISRSEGEVKFDLYLRAADSAQFLLSIFSIKSGKEELIYRTAKWSEVKKFIHQ